MLVLIGSYLLLVFVLPMALSGVMTWRSLPHGRLCPQCRSDTILLLDRWLDRVSSLLWRRGLQRRWCPGCCWEGAVRVPRWSAADTAETSDERQRQRRPEPSREASASTRTLDVRSLDVDGAAWRVMLQCWPRTGMFYGRLVFIGPGGRLWLDEVHELAGSDERDLLGRARDMPEPMLQTRLRRLVSG